MRNGKGWTKGVSRCFGLAARGPAQTIGWSQWILTSYVRVPPKKDYTVCELASMSAQTQCVCDQVGLYLTAWVTCNVLAAHFSGDFYPDDTRVLVAH